MTSFARYKNFEDSALGKTEPRATQFVPDTRSPAQFIPHRFAYQSYFDSTLLQTAILSQPKNSPIVDPQHEGLVGFAVGLHPSSETPVAVQFDPNGRGGGSAVYFLKPGQIIRPVGNSFSGFTWGIPFGWLGGGIATLVVFLTPEAEADWCDDNELCFHRARFEIKQPGDLTAAGSFNNAPKNWPMRFPWAQAFSGTVDQKGKPTAMIARPTKVIMALRGATSLAAAAPMRIIFQGTNDLSIDSAGDPSVTPAPVYEDVTWPLFASFGTSGNLSSQNPIIVREQGVARLSADDFGICLVDTGGAAALTGLFVDIARYGKL